MDNVNHLKQLVDLLDDEVDGLSTIITSMKRDDQFLDSATKTWVSDLRINRSEQPNDKADPS
jgi:hypothetical protein